MGAARVLAVVCALVSMLAACGSGLPGPKTPVPPGATEVAALDAATVIPVYADALAAGWTDVSWSASRNYAATSPVSSGTRSLAVVFDAYGGLYLNRSGSALPSAYTLELSVNGGAAPGGHLWVAGRWASNTTGRVELAPYCAGGTIPAGAWTRCRVPLSAVAPSGGTLDGFWIQEAENRARPAMYFDDLDVTSAAAVSAPAAPANLAATAGASSISLSWATCAGATGYDVYRAPAAAGPFAKLTASPQAAATYADAAVSAGSAYWYQVRAVNAGGASPVSNTASAAVPMPSGTTIVAYADALAAGWTDVSWGASRNYAATSPVGSGTRSLAVVFDAYGGLYLNRSGSALPSAYTLELSVNGGAAPGGHLWVAGRWASNTTGRVELAPYCAGGTIPAGAWTRCRVPLSLLAPSGGTLDGFWIQEAEGRARPAMYFDDVDATGAAQPTPPPPPGPVTVSVSPASATIDACKAVKLAAAVAGAADGSVTWSVQEGAAGGAVDASGNYTAPRGDGTAHVVATSNASPGATAVATVTYQERVLSVALVPGSVALTTSGKTTFAATVTTSCGATASR